MDLIPSHLHERLGVQKVTLSCVIRKSATPPAILPQKKDNANPDMTTAEKYGGRIMDELIEYAPHTTGAAYTKDNATVFHILQDIVAGTSFELSLKGFQQTRDGRGAYQALLLHNLGSAKWDKIIKDVETYCLRCEWNSRNQRFTLKIHVNKHHEAYNEMVQANQHVQYELPNEHTCVGRLLKSITSKDPAIVSAITHIEGNPNKWDNSEQAADFLLLRAPSTSNNDNIRRISTVKNKNKSSRKHKVGEKKGVELRYYTMKEYNKLSHEEKKELTLLQKERNKENAGNDQTISALKQQVEELETRLVAAIKTKEKPEEPAQCDPLKNPLTGTE